MQTVNRGWLKRQVAAGNLDAKCDYHLTDDYAYDKGNNGGKTAWMPARLRTPVFERSDQGSRFDRLIDDDFRAGQMNLSAHDFTGKSGRAWRQTDGTIALIVHSNLSYTLRLKQATQAPAVKPRVRIMAIAVEG